MTVSLGVQIRAVLWKNWILKRRHWKATAFELAMPALFMLLLAWIKSICNKVDSPSTAYHCGQAEGLGFYTDSLADYDLRHDPLSVPLVQCLIPPDSCHTDGYYREPVPQEILAPLNQALNLSLPNVYLETGYTSGGSLYPFYSVQVADGAAVYRQLEQLSRMAKVEASVLRNPSLPLDEITAAFNASDALLVLCPQDAGDPTLDAAVAALHAHLLTLITWPGDHGKVLKSFRSQAELDRYVADASYGDEGHPKVGAAVVVNQAEMASARWDYAIRLNFTQGFEQDSVAVGCPYSGCSRPYNLPPTRFKVNSLIKPVISDWLFGYTYTGFATIQKAVDDFILSSAAAQPVETRISLGLFPEAAFHSDTFQSIISFALALFFVVSFLYPVSRFIRSLVVEKETKIKETMKIMGLSSVAFNLSWFLTLILQTAIMVLLMTLAGKRSVFQFSNTGLIFIFLLAFALALVCFCFLVSTFFSKSKTAATLGTVIFFATYFPYYALTGPSTSSSAKSAACLLAPTCLGLGADVIAAYEGGLVGLQWDSMSAMPGETQFSFRLAVTMLVVDAVIYTLLAVYLELVLPSEYGTQLPVYFPLLPAFWRRVCGGRQGRGGRGERRDSGTAEALLGPEGGAAAEEQGAICEDVDPELRRQEEEGRTVSIRGLRKVFKTTGGHDRVAVAGLSLDMYEGQILALLGHNGAGKTTTVSMLTGLIPMTSGDAFMRGNRLSQDLGLIRRSLGVCPQHDTLFAELTVAEHLQLFGLLKGVPGARLREEVERWVGEVGLRDKANVVARQLSGGMKRKLCLAIAMIGDSKVVFLDEPTSGMDPYSRRATWSVLERNKRGRVVLLTTHFMDEADLLGDRIAIVADGRLVCCGSSLFLKSRYGVGYTFVVVKKDDAVPSGPIVDVVRAAVPHAELGAEAGAELSFRLPFDASGALPALLAELDARKDGDLQISTYGIGVTTLEEVFMRVGEGRGSPGLGCTGTGPSHPAPVARSDDSGELGRPAEVVVPLMGSTGKQGGGTTSSKPQSVFVRHTRALLQKRWTYALRDRKAQCCQLVIPGLLVLFGLTLIKVIGDPLVQPPLVLSEDMFSRTAAAPVPVLARSEAARAVMRQVDSFVDVASAAPPADQFGGCARGAPDLHLMSNYLLSSKAGGEAGPGVRYGAVTFSNDTTATQLAYNILVNASALHGVGVYMNLASNAILRTLNPEGHITVSSHPLPLTVVEKGASQAIQGNTVSTFILIAFCFIPASIAIFIVKESESKIKHQQIISGVSLLAYWLCNLLWDMVSYLPAFLITLTLLFAFEIRTYTHGQTAWALVVMFLAFAPAAASFTYVWSFAFKSHSAAQNVILFKNFLTGLVLSITSFILQLIDSTREVNAKLRYVFRLFPAFCFGDSLLQLSICVEDVCPKLTATGVSLTDFLHPFDWDVSMGNITFLLVEAVVYFLLTLAIEYARTQPWLMRICSEGSGCVLGWRPWRRRRGSKDGEEGSGGPQGPQAEEEGAQEDDDVRAEAERVLSGRGRGDVVRIERLRKVFQTGAGPKVAVKDLTFGIRPGTLHGFLGVNGAGKTTTLSILSGEIPSTSGTAFIAGHNILSEQSRLRRKIGFCPQFSALLDLLTVEEHLWLFAGIKCIPEEQISGLVKAKIKEMDLTDFADKAAGSLSGGNQRKTSVAVATIGDPPVLFLDEPSTGMDPVSRRFMWNVLASIRSRGTCIVLTTHSMEEAEALCTVISIMVGGRLRCIGTPQHLKSKFGQGFELIIKLNPADDLERQALSRRLGVPLQASASRADVTRFCGVLGKPGRDAEVSERGSAAVLWAILQADKALTVQSFVDWWVAEERAEHAQQFLCESFGDDGVRLLERASWFSYRFTLTARDLSLATMFQKLEQGKRRAGICEYSLGQTSMEQIFNRMCNEA